MSEIRTNTISNLAGTGPVVLTGQNPSKAYGQVSMTSGVLSTTLNVSSYTDLGVGAGRFNFINTLSSSPTVNVTARKDVAGALIGQRAGASSQSSAGVRSLNETGSLEDTTELSFSTFGDLL